MPTVLRSGPYRFFLHAGGGDGPARVHVERGDSEAKFRLDPIRLPRRHGVAASEIGEIERPVADNQATLSDMARRSGCA